MSPELEEVIAFVRDYAGWKSKVVNENTLLERDLHLAGMDGVDFLEAAETFFAVSFDIEDDDFRTLFDLKENEYLFSSEGLDLLGIGYFFEWLRGKPHSVVKDLSVGQLHQVLVKLRSKNSRDVRRDI
ncbi:hypothetical protein G5574_16340 [Pantoea stewartii]|uniref:hypothetical protein n=1 Tax=Pantoea TaxID=53335 RepID=UPI00050EE6CB|nr:MULTISPECIES: hypothetical protein [Pantoea]KGD83164.1 hypothetical protein HA47_12615 [Pantoea stewartii subsp. indologenes]MEB6535387.1 hypothetical protein [Pantoea stewartii]NRH24344.1 hypothetical protein [Pantoea stewartii]PXV76582.1 hypothetical protein C7433_102262 [Pantoea sp. PNA 03-3]QIE98399.1 hypothetical protein G5574_16340 [Pantoea stewartii]